MKRTVGRWQRGWAVLAAGFLALALAACADGDALGGDIPAPLDDNTDVVFQPEPVVDPTPDDPAEHSTWSIKKGFAIQLDPASSYFFRNTDVTVSTAEFEGAPAEDTAVVVTFDGSAVSSTVEIGSSEIRATFRVSKGAEIGKHQVIMSVDGVASEGAEFEVKGLIAIKALMNGGYLLPPIPPRLISPSPDVGSDGEDGSGSDGSGGDDSGSDSGGSGGGTGGGGAVDQGDGGGDDDPSSEPRHIAAGEKHACVTKGNLIFCWGSSEYRQLGDGMLETCHGQSNGRNNENGTCVKFSADPIPVLEGDVSQRRPFDASGVTKIVAGRNHTCALKEEGGTVWCWGSNSHGQLGGGFVNINSLNQCFPNQYSSNGYSTHYGAVQVKVDNDPKGQLGDEVLTNVVDIDASGDRTCALTKQSNLYCWGYRKDLAYYRSGGGTESVCAAVAVSTAVDDSYNPALTPIGSIDEIAVGDRIYISQGQKTKALTPIDQPQNDPRPYSLTDVEGMVGLSDLAASGDTLCAIDKNNAASCRMGDTAVMLSLGEIDSVIVGERGQYGNRYNRVVCAVHSDAAGLTCQYLTTSWLNGTRRVSWEDVVMEPRLPDEQKGRGYLPTIIGNGVKTVAAGDGFVCYVGKDKKIYCGGEAYRAGQCGEKRMNEARNTWDKTPYVVDIP